jgi:hypothetical protein
MNAYTFEFSFSEHGEDLETETTFCVNSLDQWSAWTAALDIFFDENPSSGIHSINITLTEVNE